MRRVALAFAVLLVVAGCSSDAQDPQPTIDPLGPTPTPATRAFFVSVGSFSWVDCVPTAQPFCTFQAQLRNAGSGCAEAVRGTVRFSTFSGVQLGLPRDWALPPNQIVFGSETVTYRIPFVPLDIAQATADFIVVPRWTDVSCTAAQTR